MVCLHVVEIQVMRECGLPDLFGKSVITQEGKLSDGRNFYIQSCDDSSAVIGVNVYTCVGLQNFTKYLTCQVEKFRVPEFMQIMKLDDYNPAAA